MAKERTAISEALKALASGDVDQAGDKLAHALESDGYEDAARRALGFLTVGDIESAMKVLSDACGENEGKPMDEPKKEQESVQVHETARFIERKDPEGREWEVVIIKAGTSKNGNHYPTEALQRAVPMFENAKAYDSHVTDEALKLNPSRKVGDLLGWFDNVRWDGSRESVVGRFHPAATWLREMMMNAYAEGKKDLIGFSIDAFVNSNKKQMEGQDVNYVESFEKVNSVDVVCEPAAGGEVIRVVAGLTQECNKRRKKMTKEEIVAALKEATAEERMAIAESLRAEFDGEKVTEEEEEVAEAVDPAVAKIVYNLQLKEQVRESGLPKPAQEFIMGIYKDKVTDEAEIKRAIESQRALLDKPVQSNLVIPSGISARPVFGKDAGGAALNRLLGVATPEEVRLLEDNKVGWMSLREWYTAFTGDNDFLGKIAPHRVTEAEVTTTTANSIVKNALNKALNKELVAWDEKAWWKPIVDEQDAATIQNITAIKSASLAPLNVVSEGETYAELAFSDSEETATFYKYGAFLGITLESVMKDDLNKIKTLPKKLAQSWAFTMSDLASAVFTDASGAGPTLTETARALFNTTEANLGTTALSYASYGAAKVAMRKLTSYGNGRRLGIGPKFLLVPPDLENTAIQLRNSDLDPDNAENGVNVHKGQFEVIVVNGWTDTNNWYLLADPAIAPVIQFWYYRGQRTPQLFEATDESTGALFTNDTYRYKARFFCAKAIVDWRGAYGSVVT